MKVRDQVRMALMFHVLGLRQGFQFFCLRQSFQVFGLPGFPVFWPPTGFPGNGPPGFPGDGPPGFPTNGNIFFRL